ncbi:hypothetical protein R5R35_004453 [Gryllus longicercus]|uniref:PHD-type domain-containing protein n=1 Tax=Gryllus longicercus TaxID=2509291 RepID=A0AAN9VB42_9ORTH
MASKGYKCASCSKQIRENSSSLSCVNCKNWFHKKCSDLSDEKFKNIAAESKKKGQTNWRCSGCLSEGSIVESDDEDGMDVDVSSSPTNEIFLLKMEQMFEKYLAPFREKVDKIESDIASIKSELSKNTEQNKINTENYRKLEKRVKIAEEKLSSFHDNSSDPDNTIYEINGRKRRETEVIVFNVQESEKSVGTDRRQDDYEKIAAIIPDELSEIVKNFKLRRLGRPATGKTRPLLIKTPSVTEARTLLKIKPTNETNIVFKPNLTQAQLSHLNTTF